MNCTEAVAALLATIENGGSLSDEVREHLKSCSRCGELLESARQLQTSLDRSAPPDAAPLDEAAAAASDEVVRSGRRKWLERTAVIVFAVVLFGGLMMVPIGRGDMAGSEALLVAGVAIMIGLIFMLPVLVLMVSLRSVGKGRFYKRLGPGRQLSGVCLGIAEVTGINVSLLRLCFFVLLFVKGLGLLIYLVLDLAMPVHPADRMYLLRFRLRRAFSSWRAARMG